MGELEKVASPGESQLDSMVEAPNGMIYIGTAYNGMVYRLHPQTGDVTNLGSPAIASTPWILTMVRTHQDEIYGAKGMGLFRLDWENDRLEPFGVVPSDHTTLGPNACVPVTRELVEAVDGTLYGATIRWLFRFHPGSTEIELIADMLDFERACYGLLLPLGQMPMEDCPFVVQSRFSTERVSNPLYLYHAQTEHVEPLPISGLGDAVPGHPAWWSRAGEEPLLLVPSWFEKKQKLRLLLVDPYGRKVIERWGAESDAIDLRPLLGGGLYFTTLSPAGLLCGDRENWRVRVLARNPEPVECRCLAISPRRMLGTDSYDCGDAFTRDLSTGQIYDHGRVWLDEHRCNYGPAAFAGQDGRYFLANHSEGMPSLWVTDTEANRHWRVGESAIQLVSMNDGSVWGTIGPNPRSYKFEPEKCWLPSWQARGGMLFRYCPGADQIDEVDLFPRAGVVAEAPGGQGQVLVAQGRSLFTFDPSNSQITGELSLPGAALAMALDTRRSCVYLVLSDGSIHVLCKAAQGSHLALTRLVEHFGSAERGFFVLAQSGRVVGVGANGTTAVYDPQANSLSSVKGAPPLPAGPAVDPREDAWYYAGTKVVKFRLEG